MNNRRINNKIMKDINTKNVLNTIRRKGRISRKDISIITGLTAGTITNIIGDLIENGYLVEIGNGDSEGGRKPIMLELNSSAGYAIGLELQATEIVCISSDFKANVIHCEYEKIDVKTGKDFIIERIISIIENVINKSGIDREKILGVGLAVPGPCDYQNGIMVNPPNFPDWINVPIRSIISKRLSLDVYMSKETSCAVLADYLFGEGSGMKKIFGIVLGPVGIGGAFILNGEVYQEKHRDTMDIGHTTVQIDGFKCSCGNDGCLEVQANAAAAIRYAQTLMGNGRSSILKEPISFTDIANGVLAKDSVSIEAIEICARYISLALSNVLNLLSPDRICIYGELVETCPYLFERIVIEIERREYPKIAKESQKARLSFGEISGAMGGLALVFDHLSKS